MLILFSFILLSYNNFTKSTVFTSPKFPKSNKVTEKKEKRGKRDEREREKEKEREREREGYW